MNILVVSDIHNDVENLMTFFEKIALMEFDVVVCPGDLTDMTMPKGFDKKDIAKLIIEELKSLGKPVLVVPGNMDGEIVSLLDQEKVSIHGKGKIVNDVGFYGFGGAKTPFKTSLEVSEDDVKHGLEKSYAEVKDCKVKVQVTHSPPLKTNIDKISSGAHVGSSVVREFIEKNHPSVAISAHIHEARGVDNIDDTILVNSGRFPEGHCALVSIEDGKVAVKMICLI